jgi:hypothetical protein
MPPGLIEEENSMSARSDFGCNLIEVKLHSFGVASLPQSYFQYLCGLGRLRAIPQSERRHHALASEGTGRRGLHDLLHI